MHYQLRLGALVQEIIPPRVEPAGFGYGGYEYSGTKACLLYRRWVGSIIGSSIDTNYLPA
jgi:hypothetical protein